MNVGRIRRTALKSYAMAFRATAGLVTIYRSYGTPQQTQHEMRAVKCNEKNRPSDVIFQFIERANLVRGDIIQQQGSGDLWRIYDTEDFIEFGTLIYFEAKVRKFSQHGHEVTRTPTHTTVTVQGNVLGGLIVNSPNSVQNIAIQVSPEFDNACRQLREILSDKRITDLEREEGLSELERLEQLAKRDRSPDLLERAKNRIESVRAIVSSVQEIATVATPWLAALWQCFSK